MAFKQTGHSSSSRTFVEMATFGFEALSEVSWTSSAMSNVSSYSGGSMTSGFGLKSS